MWCVCVCACLSVYHVIDIQLTFTPMHMRIKSILLGKDER